MRAFRHERQEAWFNGLESTFLTLAGVPEEVLFDNARALVIEHDAQTRTVVFNAKLLAFARHWGFRPRACAPYRARTKGKAENGIAYVKKNAIAGRTFASWEALEAHLARWEREIANARIHGTTGEVPLVRFGRDEASRLKSIADRPPFQSCRVLERRVRNDCAVEVDGNAYSVPWRLIGEQVEVVVSSHQVRVRHGLHEVAVHTLAEGRRHRVIDPTHLAGVAGANGWSRRAGEAWAEEPGPLPASDLLRPLTEYEAMIGGSF